MSCTATARERRSLLTHRLRLRIIFVSRLRVVDGAVLLDWERRIGGSGLPAADTIPIAANMNIEAHCFSLTTGARLGVFHRPALESLGVDGTLATIAGQVLHTHAPVMNKFSHSAPTSSASWLRVLGVAAAVFTVVEPEKWLRSRSEAGVPSLFA